MDQEQPVKKKKEMVIPELKFKKALVRKTLIGKDGMTYEVEEYIDVPIFEKEEK